jgi:hypothetical protein
MPLVIAPKTTAPQRVWRAPAMPWLLTWLPALLVVLASVGGLEAFWRAGGVHATVSADNKDLWYFWRNQVDRPDGRVVVLLGTSRIKCDIALAVLEREVDLHAVQLGIDGITSPIGILRDLAADPCFKGVVLCEMFVPLIDRSRWNDCDGFVSYRPARLAGYLDSVLTLRAHSTFAFLDRRLGPLSIAKAWSDSGTWQLPAATLDRCDFNRSLGFQPRAIALDAQLQKQPTPRDRFALSRAVPFEQLASACDEIDSLVCVIRSRGGGVVFIHLPSSGDQLADEETAFPRTQYWNRFIKRMSAPCIHFRDVAALRAYTPSDGVHLSEDDIRGFTTALAKEVERVGFGRCVVATNTQRS